MTSLTACNAHLAPPRGDNDEEWPKRLSFGGDTLSEAGTAPAKLAYEPSHEAEETRTCRNGNINTQRGIGSNPASSEYRPYAKS
jgi:hypothetical protein